MTGLFYMQYLSAELAVEAAGTFTLGELGQERIVRCACEKVEGAEDGQRSAGRSERARRLQWTVEWSLVGRIPAACSLGGGAGPKASPLLREFDAALRG